MPEERKTPTLADLQNPYALLSADDEEDESPRQKYIRRLGNPYAAIEDQVEDSPLEVEVSNPPSSIAFENLDLEFDIQVTPPLTKSEFRSQCRGLFLPYSPGNSNRLSQVFSEFIEKNSSRSAIERGKIVSGLSKYDLSDLGPLKTHFNREQKERIAAKLENIVRSSTQS